VSERSQPGPPHTAPAGEVDDGEGGHTDPPSQALPVLAGTVRVMPARAPASGLPGERRPVIPTVQAAVVAAGGFVAGAAVVGFVHRRRRREAALVKGRRARRRAAHGSRAAGKTAELVQIVSSRSLLVDVHLLGSPGDR
jgi:hypothetical protein